MRTHRLHSFRTVSSILVASTAIIAGHGIAGGQTGGDWTQYRHTHTNNTHVTSGLDQIYNGAIQTANEVRATPVVADGKIFVGNHDSGELQAFDLASGDLLWQEQAPNWVHSEMIYADGRIFVGFGNRFFDPTHPEGIRGTGESGVLSLDPDTGEQQWRFDTPGEVMPTPAVVGGAVYAVTGDRTLYKLDPTTGDELHTADLGHVVSMSSPSEHDGVLFFGGGAPAPYTFFAYDTAEDEMAWEAEFPEFNRGLDDVPPAVDEGLVVTTANRALFPGIAGPRETHTIVAIDEQSGQERWRHDIGTGPAPTNNRSGAPTISDGVVYVGSPTMSAAYAYDLHTGDQLWRNPIGAIKGAPVIDGEDAYFSTTAGDVYRLDTRSGEITGKLGLEGALAPAGPTIVDDSLMVPSQSRNVYVTPLDEFPAASAPEAPAGSLGSSPDPLGSAETVAGSLGAETGSFDPAY